MILLEKFNFPSPQCFIQRIFANLYILNTNNPTLYEGCHMKCVFALFFKSPNYCFLIDSLQDNMSNFPKEINGEELLTTFIGFPLLSSFYRIAVSTLVLKPASLFQKVEYLPVLQLSQGISSLHHRSEVLFLF